MDSALTFTETPSAPDDPLKWKYLLAWESWRSFSRCACWSVLCSCDIFLAVGLFVLREWMELMLCPACHFDSRGSASFGRAAVLRLSSPLPFHCYIPRRGRYCFIPSPLKKSHYKWCAVSEMSGLPLTRTRQPLVCYRRFTLWLREEGSEREDSKIYRFSHLSATSSPTRKPVLVFTLCNNSFIPGTSLSWVNIDFFFLPSFPCIMLWLICF